MNEEEINRTQLFKMGDLVKIAKDLVPAMSHFDADCEAIVIGSYADQYGGDNHNSYTLYLKGGGKTSWYDGEQLTLIEANQTSKLKAWEEEVEAERKQKSDLDWIFSHGDEVLMGPHGATVQALANCFGLTNLWGDRGEGITYSYNTAYTMALAEPYLKNSDKAGWLEACEKFNNHKRL
jgi:hypothetical protein